MQAYTVFDFLPAQARSPATALILVTGGRVKGLLREQPLKRLPRRRCIQVAFTEIPQVSQE